MYVCLNDFPLYFNIDGMSERLVLLISILALLLNLQPVTQLLPLRGLKKIFWRTVSLALAADEGGPMRRPVRPRAATPMASSSAAATKSSRWLMVGWICK